MNKLAINSVFKSINFTLKFASRNSFNIYRRELNIFKGVSVNSKQYISSIPLKRFSTQAATDSENIKSSTDSEGKDEKSEEYHSIIKNDERGKGSVESLEFQAETRKLLDIVAKSLYSEKEVFIRELVSNCSDALEKLRYIVSRGEGVLDSNLPLEIHVGVDENKKTFTIQDTGLGMTKNEIIENLGIIAKSGSKAFLAKLEESGSQVDKNIIGQFGVGFYSSFIVSEKVEVFTKSYLPDSMAYKWSSDGAGSYELSEAENVERGTKIVVHLKGDCYDYSKEDIVKNIIKKYSNFVGVPIFLNGKRLNVIQPIWTLESKEVTDTMHEEFYRFISNSFDAPRYRLHYKTDAPLNIRSIFYVPEYKPSLFDMSRDNDVSVSLYSRKIMIMSKANHILPRWLRFLRGVVDSEDMPLNLSRELLQDSSLIRKIRWVLTNRLIKFFLEQAKKNKEKYLEFYKDYGLFFREGIVTTTEQDQREEISRLLRFESSKLPPGEVTNLEEYVDRMKAGARNIFYFSAPSRQLAESSPYMEAMVNKDVEVLFCYENYDELVLMNLGQYDKKNLRSVENELNEVQAGEEDKQLDKDGLTNEQCEDLLNWMQVVLGPRVSKTKATKRLSQHPCVISVLEMGAARHFIKTTLADKSEEEKFRILNPTLEVNPNHPIIRQLQELKSSDVDLARLVVEQLFDNAMIAAGLMTDARSMLPRLNQLITKSLQWKGQNN